MKKYVNELIKILGCEIKQPYKIDERLAVFMPKDYIEFMSITDGLSLSISEIFSYYDLPKENGEENDFKQKYLDAYGLDYRAYEWLFFANDGMGGYYAFRNTQDDDKVYYFDHEFPSDLKTYKTFTHFIKQVIKDEKEIFKKSC